MSVAEDSARKPVPQFTTFKNVGYDFHAFLKIPEAISGYSRTSACFALSIDHDLKCRRNDCPSNKLALGDAMLALTLSTI